MKTLRIILHMARADFLERVRRYSFLIILGMVVWLGYASAAGILVMSIEPNYVGQINSPWVGALMTVTVTLFLGWFGFYLVKGSVSRDYETGVGQIIATTPLSRPSYALGKWLSNFAVLGIMILIVMTAGIAMNLLAGEAPLELGALVAPLLLIALPCMAIVASLAVLFEAIGWLRGGSGNVLYFFLFLLLLAPTIAAETYQPLFDFTGLRLVGDSVSAAAKQVYPETPGGFSFQIMNTVAAPLRFRYDGIAWTPDIILPRLLFVLVALGLVLLASVFFDRFNSSKAIRRKEQRGRVSIAQKTDAAPRLPEVHLTPLSTARRFRFLALYTAELKMLLKGHRWWWYLISLGLIIAQFAVPPETTPFLLAITWLWIVLLLSGLGNREALYNTREIVFSAPRPTLKQLPALWLAAMTVLAGLGSGAWLHYLLQGDLAHLLAWLGGVLFIPALASALGVLTRSRKPFEVIYVTWMYLILNEAPPLDFVGVTAQSPWPIYLLLAIGLLALSLFVRQWQLSDSRISK